MSNLPVSGTVPGLERLTGALRIGHFIGARLGPLFANADRPHFHEHFLHSTIQKGMHGSKNQVEHFVHAGRVDCCRYRRPHHRLHRGLLCRLPHPDRFRVCLRRHPPRNSGARTWRASRPFPVPTQVAIVPKGVAWVAGTTAPSPQAAIRSFELHLPGNAPWAACGRPRDGFL